MDKIKIIKKFQKGNDHNVFLVNLNRKKFVLKQYNFRSEKSVKSEAKLISYLSNKKCLVPKIRKIENKSYFFYNRKPSILMSYLPGDLLLQKIINKSILEKAGEVIGKIDKHSYKIKIVDTKRIIPVNDILKENFFIENINLLKSLSKFPIIKKDVQKIIEEKKIFLPKIKKLSLGLFHNDICEKNIIINNKKIVGVIDFSDYIKTFPIISFASASAHLCLNDKYWQKNLMIFGKNYRKYFRFPEWQKSKDVFPFLMKHRLLNEIIINLYLKKLNKAKDVNNTNNILFKKFITLSKIPEKNIMRVINKIK